MSPDLIHIVQAVAIIALSVAVIYLSVAVRKTNASILYLMDPYRSTRDG